MKNMRVWSGLLLIFIVGVIIGALTATFVVRNHFRGMLRGGPARASHHITERLVKDLDLTDDQLAEIDKILDETRPRMEEMSSEFFESMKAETEEQISRVREVLDDSQKAEFDRRKAEMEERFRRFRDEKGRRRPGPGRRNMPEPPPGG